MTDDLTVIHKANTLHKEFLQRLELELAQAVKDGVDLAVSPFEWEAVPVRGAVACRLQTTFMRVEKGWHAPPGWTIYHASEVGQ